jgi:endonuclease YncB( thermonuclease family)
VKFEGNARVVDGKTLQIGDKLFVLNGADSPAAGQTCTDKAGMAWECGRKAADRLFQLIDGRHVVCIGKDVARNGIAALCKVGTTDLGRTLVSEGLALAPQAVSKTYLPEEAAARSAQRGMWVGTFKTPWDFRAEN